MRGIDDAVLTGLADLSPERLCAITGADHVDILRLRYRAGKRAIVHVATRTGAEHSEGTLWFFKGDKAKRLFRRNKRTARFDPETQAFFEPFPNDHRMPQIRDFLSRVETILPALTGQSAGAAPVLLRYRPGLSCTFRCQLADRAQSFLKLVNDDDPARLLAANLAMTSALEGRAVRVAPALGIDPEVSAIAYAEAPGVPLDVALLETGDLTLIDQAVAALRAFWDAPITPERTMDSAALLHRAQESAEFVAVTAPALAAATDAHVARLRDCPPSCDLRPVHADMKLEHLFLSGDICTLIDTESLSNGLPDYDLAQLYGRLWQAEYEGQLPRPLVEAAANRVRAAAGPAFDWCLGVVTLRLAKFYAQRPAPNMEIAIRAMLERLA